MYHELQTTTDQVVDVTETVVHPSSWNSIQGKKKYIYQAEHTLTT